MKKKGFTLIELLAVIVILAIIALIATPAILGVIEKAKKGSFKNSVYGIIDSANIYLTENIELNGQNFLFTCDGTDCELENGDKLSFKGEVPISGSVRVDNENKIVVEYISNGTYCAYGTLENLVIDKNCEELDVTNPVLDDSKLNVTTTTSSLTVNILKGFAKDPESGIKEYKVTVNGETKILKEIGTLTFTGLTKNKIYEVKIEVENRKGLKSGLTKEYTTLQFVSPSIALTNTPTTAVNGYLKSQVAKITYNGTNISSPKYFVKTTREGTSSLAVTATCGTGTTPSTCTNVTSTKTLTANTWYQVSGNVSITYSKSASETGTVYTITYDGTNYSGASTATISKIDTTGPTVTLGSAAIKTNSITIPITASDSESGINTATCKYSTTSGSYTTNATSVSTTGCSITGLKTKTTYYYQVCVTDKVGNSTCKTGNNATSSMSNPSITLTNTPTTAQNGYLKSQVAKVTYNSSNITSPQYFVKTTREGTSSLAVTATCGTGTTPSTCTNVTSTKTLTANTWYQVSGNVSITYSKSASETGTVYTITYDGTNYSGASTATISKISNLVTYTVKHYQMDTDMKNYTLVDTEEKKDYAHYKVTPSVKTYKGFNSPSTQTITVANDGTSIVEYQYTRKQILVTFNKNITGNDTTTTQTFTYGVTGQKLVDTGFTESGLTLIGWSRSTTGYAEYAKLSGVSDNWIDTYAPKINIYAVWTDSPSITLTNSPTTAQNGYLKSQVATIKYSKQNIKNPKYYVKTTRTGVSSIAVTKSCGTGTNPGMCNSVTSTTTLSANTWYQVSGNVKVTYNEAASTTATLYSATYDGASLKTTKNATISKIDTTAPTVTLGTLAVKTNSITIPITAVDNETGINTPTCKYGTTSGSYTTNANSVSTTGCSITGLKTNTTYYYQVCVSNKVGISTCKTGSTKSSTMTNPSITLTNTPTTAVDGYLKSQVAKITYNGTNISSPKYFVKTTREGTSSLAVTKSCGTGTTPGTCTNVTSTKTLTANTWYQVSGNVNVTYNKAASETGTVYAIIYDGTNYSGASTATISKIDTTGPTIENVSVTNNLSSSQQVSATLNDNKGIVGYYFGTSNSASVSYTTISSTTSYAFSTTVNTAGTYYLRTIDIVGNTTIQTIGTFFQTALNANGGTVSITKVITLNGNSVQLPSATRSGYTYRGWSAQSNATSGVTTYKPTSSATLYASWLDTVRPTLSMSVTPVSNGMGFEGNMSVFHSTNYVNYTFTFSDNIGVTGYYWGTTNPTSVSSVSWTSIGNGSTTISRGYFGSGANMTVTSQYPTGAYYFAVRDAAGNISSVVSKCTAGRFIMYASNQTIYNTFNNSNLLINHSSASNKAVITIANVGTVDAVFGTPKVFTGTTASSYIVRTSPASSNVYAYYVFY